MKRYTRKRITKMLETVGACWAHTDMKHLRHDDPAIFKEKRLKTYHIYPDVELSEGYGILRFLNLNALAEYLKDRLKETEL